MIKSSEVICRFLTAILRSIAILLAPTYSCYLPSQPITLLHIAKHVFSYVISMNSTYTNGVSNPGALRPLYNLWFYKETSGCGTEKIF